MCFVVSTTPPKVQRRHAPKQLELPPPQLQQTNDIADERLSSSPSTHSVTLIRSFRPFSMQLTVVLQPSFLPSARLEH